MNIKEIMTTNIITKDISSSLNEIACTFKDFDIGFLPITENNKVIGVITDRDIVVKIISNNDNKIDSYLNRDIIKINVNSSIEDVLSLMKNKKVKRIIVEDNNLMVGIISISDLLNYNKIDIIDSLKIIFTPKKNHNSENNSVKEFYL